MNHKNYIYIFMNDEIRDLYFYEYLSIISLIHTQNYKTIFIYTLQTLHGKYIKLLNSFNYNIQFKSISLYDNHNLSILECIKYSLINIHNGIYVDSRFMFINPFNKYDDKIYFSFKDYLIGNLSKYNLKVNEEELINKKYNSYHQINDDDVFMINEQNKYLINNIITDWNFSTYFNLINNYSLLFIDLDEQYLNTFIINNLCQEFSTITFHLLIIYILTYPYTHYSENKINELIHYNVNNKNKFSLFNNLDHIYWINLDRSKDRNIKMEKNMTYFSSLNTRIEAIDGNNILNIKDLNFHFLDSKISDKNKPNNSNIEYAIILSHLTALEKIKTNIEKNNEKYNKFGYSLVFEDDVSFDFISYWEKDLYSLVQEAPSDWEIIMLGNFTLNLNYENNYRSWNNEWSALSYIINHNSLNKLDIIKQNNKYDIFPDVMVADNYLFRTFKTYVYKYPYFTFPNSNDSTIHQDHVLYHQIYKNINYYILENQNKYFILEN